MKKKKAAPGKKVYKAPDDTAGMLQEPAMQYKAASGLFPAVKAFTYNEFKKIADATPFTQAEWAAMLHVSERTLQRYAKNNGSFASINAERAMQIAHVLDRARAVLGQIENFYHWLKRGPSTLEGKLGFQSLTTADGLNKILTQLGRIEHGLFA